MSFKTMTLLVLVAGLQPAMAGEPIPLGSPGFPSSTMDATGRLVEDWGTVDVRLDGENVVDGKTEVGQINIDDLVPAAQAVSHHGIVQMTRIAYRAPIFPAGVDVLQIRLKETKGQAARVSVTLDVSTGIQLGQRTARIGGRTVLVLPHDVVNDQPLLDWGYCDEASSLPGWAKPEGKSDTAFGNIRAGMGGVPIVYRFAVTPGGSANVVLGLCESHWAEVGQRPVKCHVEGAAPQTVDPVAEWGQHKPGALLFRAKDDDGDGKLQVTVRPVYNAPDRNPILNVIWLFPPGEAPPLDKVIAGQWNDNARHYVDVGGKNDQSIHPPGKLNFSLELPENGTRELTFLVACPGGSAPIPELSDWSSTTLQRATRDVWTDWSQQ